jgi:hypothetical protein
MTIEDEMYLLDVVDEFPTITLARLKALVEQNVGKNPSISTLSRILIRHKYTFKRLIRVSVRSTGPEIELARMEFSHTMAELQAQGDRTFIFLDEVGFQVSQRPHYGRSKAKTTPQLVVGAIRTRNITVMAAITEDALFHYLVLEDNGNGVNLIRFLHEIVDICVLNNIANPVLIMDNARFHHSVVVVQAMVELNLVCLYLPVYSPFFNPIENCFSQWKNYVRRLFAQTEEELIAGIVNFENIITPENCAAYVNRAFDQYMACLGGQIAFQN